MSISVLDKNEKLLKVSFVANLLIYIVFTPPVCKAELTRLFNYKEMSSAVIFLLTAFVVPIPKKPDRNFCPVREKFNH